MTNPIKLLLIFLATLYTVACKEESSLFLEEEKLVEILCDVHIAEASLRELNADKKEEAAAHLYNQIYTIHEIDQPTLDSTLFYLKRNPKLMAGVYKKVNERLEKMEIENE